MRQLYTQALLYQREVSIKETLARASGSGAFSLQEPAMPPDSLETLMLRRRADLDQARRALGEVLQVEHAAQRARDSAEARIVAETRLAAASDSDSDVERFARWLPRGQAALQAAELVLAEAADATTHQRAELNLVRQAVAATETLLLRRQEEQRASE